MGTAERKYWLFKSEPTTYSFSDLLSEPDKTAEWDGVRNYQARNFLRDEIKLGDGILFYHSSNDARAVIGTARVVREGYPDSTAWDPDSNHYDSKSTPDRPIWFMVDIQADGRVRQTGDVNRDQGKSPVTRNDVGAAWGSAVHSASGETGVDRCCRHREPALTGPITKGASLRLTYKLATERAIV